MWYRDRAELDKISKAGVYTFFNEIGNPVVRMNSSFWLECERDDTAFTIPVMVTGNWEAWVATAIINTLHKEKASFIDVGANVGYYSVMASTAGFPVLSFEPNSEVFQFLSRNMELNQCQNYRISTAGVGSKHDTLVLHEPGKNHSGAGSFCGEGEGKECQVVPLNSVETYGHSFVLKVDVEGFEREVWMGATDIRNETNNTWFIEWVPIRHGIEYNREWLTEVLETHDILMVGHNGKLQPVGVEEALDVEFETIVFRSRLPKE